jgi:hypothetical protein
MTDICMDTEFVEDGSTIKLLSIGLVAADGAELYRVCADPYAMEAAMHHEWVRENVLPSLPVAMTADWWRWDEGHPDAACVFLRHQVAEDVKNFILTTEDPQLWADYGAYDHVALAQLFGPMIDLPEGIPMWTSDLRQEWARAGRPDLPSLPGVTEHNALSDAREVMFRLRWLRKRAEARPELPGPVAPGAPQPAVRAGDNTNYGTEGERA